MSNIIWNKFTNESKEEYIEFLKIFGSLSGLFKDNKNGKNAKKPYLYYRNHEQLFTRIFEVEDLTRNDSAFDALGSWDGDRVGIGLKTWIHTRDLTYQKVAEFNKLAPKEISPLIDKGDSYAVIKKVASLRNDRIMLDKRLHNTNRDVYHFVTRDDNVMNIVETSYDLIDLNSIELISSDETTFTFKDRLHKYKFYKSKSVLLEEFDASNYEIIESIPIKQFEDPFELIKMIKLDTNIKESENKNDVIYLPLYQDKKEGMVVSDCSGVNIRNGKSKNKGSNTPRPLYEIEVRISKWIHKVFPYFFDLNALNLVDIKNEELNDFDLILPDGRVLRGRVKQANGKSLQTNPQGDLGKWILKDVLGLENREIVTMELLERLGIDSLKITKLGRKRFKITVGETGSYEKFKLENQEKIIESKCSARVYFRPEYVNQIEND